MHLRNVLEPKSLGIKNN